LQFHPEKPLLGPVWPLLAKFIQKSFVDFTRYTDPNAEDVETWQQYQNDAAKVMNFGPPDYPLLPTLVFGNDRLNTEKCNYLQDAPYFYSTKSGQSVQQDESYKEWL
jgi:hypothetical protein